jgi:hypothetical protein
VAQVVAQLATDVGPLDEGVHLVDPHPVEAGGIGLQSVEQRDRFAVRQRYNDVGASRNMTENVLGAARCPHPHHFHSSRTGRKFSDVRVGLACIALGEREITSDSIWAGYASPYR